MTYINRYKDLAPIMTLMMQKTLADTNLYIEYLIELFGEKAIEERTGVNLENLMPDDITKILEAFNPMSVIIEDFENKRRSGMRPQEIYRFYAKYVAPESSEEENRIKDFVKEARKDYESNLAEDEEILDEAISRLKALKVSSDVIENLKLGNVTCCKQVRTHEEEYPVKFDPDLYSLTQHLSNNGMFVFYTLDANTVYHLLYVSQDKLRWEEEHKMIANGIFPALEYNKVTRKFAKEVLEFN